MISATDFRVDLISSSRLGFYYFEFSLALKGGSELGKVQGRKESLMGQGLCELIGLGFDN